MSKTLIMTKGLPGSGKSHWARALVRDEPGYVRVNKDDLRDMLHDGKWSQDREKLVLRVRDLAIVDALQSGKHVIVDDTNFGLKHESRLRELAKANGAAFEIKDFTQVSIDTCIERDLKRTKSVGEAVIRKMWRDYLAPKPPVIEYNPELPSCVICDIDGTVALMNGRGPYDGHLCDTDVPNAPVVGLVRRLMLQGHRVIFVSGRFESVRSKTEIWLSNHVMYPTNQPILFMRQDGDSREDSIIKHEIYEREFKGKYNVWFVLDDRNRVVNTWRELGLTCLQVADGDF